MLVGKGTHALKQRISFLQDGAFMKTLRLTLMPIIFLFGMVANANPDEIAKQAFEAGKKFYAEEEYIKAADQFRLAYNTRKSWKLLFNIGQAEAAAKRHGLALEAFELYLADGGDAIPAARQAQIHEELTRLRNMVGYIEVITVDGAQIYINGVLRGTAPINSAIAVTGGKTQTVQVVVDGNELAPESIVVPGTRSASIRIGLGSEGDDVAAQEMPPERSDEAVAANEGTSNAAQKTSHKPNVMRIAGWGLTGAGAGALLAGGILGGKALSMNSDLKKECGDGACVESDFEDEEASRKKFSTASTVLFITGGTLAATGVVLLVLDGLFRKESSSIAQRPQRALNVNLTVGNSFAGAIVSGRF